MTNDELAKYYADLLISQYKSKPKAYETVKAIASQAILDQLPIDVQNAYNLETAVGVQLDVLAKYAGATRANNTAKGVVNLDDDDFRKLIKLAIIRNNSGSSMYDIVNLLEQNFPNLIKVYDSTNMSLNYIISEDIGTIALLDVLLTGAYLPKPMGVGIAVISIPSFTTTYFGFRTYSSAGTNIAPFNFYAFYNSTYRWLSYND
jgi:hypothetical protein